MEERLTEIKTILNEEYEGKMPKYFLEACANDLYDCLFVHEYPLDEIYSIITNYKMEAEMEDDFSEDYIFSQLIDLLPNGPTTAKRLYDSFMYEMDLLATFLKLVNDNSEYITKEELKNAKIKAFHTFDKQVLDFCCIFDDDIDED